MTHLCKSPGESETTVEGAAEESGDSTTTPGTSAIAEGPTEEGAEGEGLSTTTGWSNRMLLYD